AVTVEGGLFGDLGGADGTVPDKWCHTVQGCRGGGVTLQRGAELARPVHHVLTPQATQQVVVLDRQGDALADVLAEPRGDRAGVAAAHHQIHATTGEVLEEGVILGDLHRVVGGDQGGGGGGDEGWVVVLAGGEDIEADLLGLERDL